MSDTSGRRVHEEYRSICAALDKLRNLRSQALWRSFGCKLFLRHRKSENYITLAKALHEEIKIVEGIADGIWRRLKE